MIDPATAFRLDGKVALITGGSRGIGLAIGEAFVAAGAAVVLNARRQEELDEAVAKLRSHGGRASAVASSVDEDGAPERAAAHCVDEHGSLDILVNNAGTNPQYGPLAEADMKAVRKVWAVNQEAPLRFVQAAWDAWMRDHGGVVLNMASLGGVRVEPKLGAYNVSKAALSHLTRQLAIEMAPTVRVNALAPGVVKTKLSEALWVTGEDAVAARHPMARLAEPDDVAAAALFFASDASSWITGRTLVIDGGLSLT